MTWLPIAQQQPAVGQRCLVWDIRYREETLAYWTRDHTFEEWQRGKSRRVDASHWQPLPGPPEGEPKPL